MSDKLNKMAESYQKKVSHDCQADNCRTCFDITKAFKAGHSSRDADVIKLQADLKKAVDALEFYADKSNWNTNFAISGSRVILMSDSDDRLEIGDEIHGGKLARSILKELRGDK